MAALVHDASLAYDGARVDSVVEATALALRTRGLQAETRAQFAFLRTLVETAPSLFIHIGTDGTIRNQNAAAVEAAGFDDQEEMRGRPFWDVFIDPAERPQVIERFEADAPAFPPGEFENAFTNPRGERRVIFWRSAPVKDPRGRVTGIISGGLDITERQLEAEARERERTFLNAIANNAPSLLCLIEDDGTVAPFATNRAFERRLEVDPETVGGEAFWERYVAPEDADAVREIVRRVSAGEAVGPHDHVWVTSAGERVDVAWSCTALPAMDERRLLLVSGVDVTDRRHREQELQRERDATTTVLESISSVVVVLDRDGTIRDRSDDNPRAAANRAFRQALGWRDVDLVNARFLELLVEDDDGRGAAAIATAAAGSASEEVESEWHCADGTVRAFAWSAVPVSDATGRRDVARARRGHRHHGATPARARGRAAPRVRGGDHRDDPHLPGHRRARRDDPGGRRQHVVLRRLRLDGHGDRRRAVLRHRRAVDRRRRADARRRTRSTASRSARSSRAGTPATATAASSRGRHAP